MRTLFNGVYAPSTVGMLLREFTFGYARQLESVLREHPGGVVWAGRSAARGRAAGVRRHRFAAAPGLRARQTGRSYGHTKIAGNARHPQAGCGVLRDATVVAYARRARIPRWCNACWGTRSGFNIDRQRHGLHHPTVRRQRRTQPPGSRATPSRGVQINSTPSHPTTCGKVERFHQTLKPANHRSNQGLPTARRPQRTPKEIALNPKRRFRAIPMS